MSTTYVHTSYHIFLLSNEVHLRIFYSSRRCVVTSLSHSQTATGESHRMFRDAGVKITLVCFLPPRPVSLPYRDRQITIATTRVSRSTTRFPFPLWTLFMEPMRGSSWESGTAAARGGRDDHRIKSGFVFLSAVSRFFGSECSRRAEKGPRQNGKHNLYMHKFDRRGGFSAPLPNLLHEMCQVDGVDLWAGDVAPPPHLSICSEVFLRTYVCRLGLGGGRSRRRRSDRKKCVVGGVHEMQMASWINTKLLDAGGGQLRSVPPDQYCADGVVLGSHVLPNFVRNVHGDPWS